MHIEMITTFIYAASAEPLKSVNGRKCLFLLRVTIPPCLPLCSHSPEAAQRAHDLHTDAAGHLGGAVLQNPLPRHFHEGGSGPQDQPAGVTCTGKQATAQMDATLF